MTYEGEKMQTLDEQVEAAKEEAGRERLAELEAEIEAAGEQLGAATVEHERTKDARDEALRRYRRALSRHRQLLAGQA